MNYNLVNRLAYEAERSLANGSISGTYAKVGNAFSNPIRILILQNQTDVAATFSLDGSTDLITLQSKIVLTLDISTNRSNQNSFNIAQGTQVWVKATNPTTGSVFVSAIYATGPTQ